MAAEYERDTESEVVNLPRLFAQNFHKFLIQQSSVPFNVDRVSFDLRTESEDPDGTTHIMVKPVAFEKIPEMGTKGFFLLSSSSLNEAYLVELEDHLFYDDPIDFIGITRVTNPNLDENKSKWAKNIRSKKVSPIFQNQSYEVTSALGIILNGSRQASAQLYGQDKYLKAFFEAIKG